MTAAVTDVQQPDYRTDRQILDTKKVVSLTPEEVIAFQSCMKSSSLIMPAIAGAAVGYGIVAVTPFRAYAKHSAVIGGMLGLVSAKYVAAKICIDQVASMPNSTLKNRLAEAGYYGKFLSDSQYQSFQSPNVQSEAQDSSTGIVFDDYPPMNSYDTYSSFNDSSDARASSEETDLTEPINLQQKGISYDELRHRNREEFYRKNKQWYTPKAPESSPTGTTKQFPAPADSPPIQGKSNKYGDVWG